MTDRFFATYLIETSGEIEPVVAELAGEQSTATRLRVPLETDALIEKFAARVETITVVGEKPTPSLASIGTKGALYVQARIVISWPVHNVGSSLPMLMTTLLGNQTGMRRLSGIRLESIDLPPSFIQTTPRPAFGIDGTRKLSGVFGRPLIGSVVKPNIGLSPDDTALVVRDLAAAGVDFIKDDELIANPPYSPISQRVPAAMRVLNQHAEKTGKKVMYAFNITGDTDEMRRGHDTVLENGGTCVMVNMNSVGLAGLVALRKHCSLPIHGHRAGWAAMTRAPMLGLDFAPYQTIHRLAGVDHIHVSGLGGKFWETEESIVSSARDCLTPLSLPDQPDDRAMPVVSGGSTVRQVAPTYTKMDTKDLIYACGGGIMAHPGGPAEGVRSLIDAWESAMQNIGLEQYAATRPALAAALEHWPAA